MCYRYIIDLCTPGLSAENSSMTITDQKVKHYFSRTGTPAAMRSSLFDSPIH